MFIGRNPHSNNEITFFFIRLALKKEGHRQHQRAVQTWNHPYGHAQQTAKKDLPPVGTATKNPANASDELYQSHCRPLFLNEVTDRPAVGGKL